MFDRIVKILKKDFRRKESLYYRKYIKVGK